jgi:hypothetical protein
MKDFAGSSITYYGLAREKLINKYPWLARVLVILALICMTGLAIYLVSDLVSYASNPDYNAAGIGPDLNGPENGKSSAASDNEKSGNAGTNSSLNTSRQTGKQSPANLSMINSSLQSGQAARAVAAAGKSSSSHSSGSKHHSSSSSKSSSANLAKVSVNTSNLTNESATSAPMPTNATETVAMPANVTANAGAISQGAEAAAPTALASLPLAAISNLANPAGKTAAIEPESTIVFKTETKDDGGSIGDAADKAKSSSPETKNIKFMNAKAKSLAAKKSSQAATSPASKAKEARDKISANKDRIEQAMKKKAALMRSKPA